MRQSNALGFLEVDALGGHGHLKGQMTSQRVSTISNSRTSTGPNGISTGHIRQSELPSGRTGRGSRQIGKDSHRSHHHDLQAVNSVGKVEFHQMLSVVMLMREEQVQLHNDVRIWHDNQSLMLQSWLDEHKDGITAVTEVVDPPLSAPPTLEGSGIDCAPLATTLLRVSPMKVRPVEQDILSLNSVNDGACEDSSASSAFWDTRGSSDSASLGMKPQSSAESKLSLPSSVAVTLSVPSVRSSQSSNNGTRTESGVRTSRAICTEEQEEGFSSERTGVTESVENFTSFGERFLHAKQFQAKRLSQQPDALQMCRMSVSGSDQTFTTAASLPVPRTSVLGRSSLRPGDAPRVSSAFMRHISEGPESEHQAWTFDLFALDDCWEDPAVSSEEQTQIQSKLTEVLNQRSAANANRVKAVYSTRGRKSTIKQLGPLEEEQLSLLRQYHGKVILRPGGFKRLVWDLLMVIMMAVDAVSTPFLICFNPPDTDIGTAASVLSLLFWGNDILMNFISGYNEYGGVVMDPSTIARHYINTWLGVDILFVALDIFRTFFSAADPTQRRLVRLARGVALLRLLKLRRVIGEINMKLRSEYLTVIIAIVFKIFAILLVTHWMACGWYLVGTVRDGSISHPTWLFASNRADDPLLDNYLLSFHWAVAQIHGDMEEIYPQNNIERIYAVIVLLLALFAFTVFIGNFASLLGNLWSGQVFKARQFWLLRQYLKQMTVSPECSGKIEAYLTHVMFRREQEVDADNVVILSYLSKPLKDDLKAESYSSCICKHRLFGFICFEKEHGLSQLVDAFATLWLSAGDFVFLCGDSLESMVFLMDGDAEYHLESPHWVQKVYSGQWVSEPVLWVTEWIGLGDLVVSDSCQVVSINAEAFKFHSRIHISLIDLMRQYAQQFLKMLNGVAPDDLTDIMSNNFSPEKVLLDSKTMTDETLQTLHTERPSWFSPSPLDAPSERTSWSKTTTVNTATTA